VKWIPELALLWDGVCRVMLIGAGDNLPGTYLKPPPSDVHFACFSACFTVCHVVGPPEPATPALHLMPTFPLQLVNQVIDELGHAYRDRSHPTFSPRRTGAYKALRTCTLVSKKWTVRSRGHLFKKVKIEVREGLPTLTPPTSILPYVKKLEVWCGHQPTQATFTTDLSKTFSSAPVERLRITGGALAGKRACIQEFISAHSTTLRAVKFNFCSLSPYNIADIVLGPHHLKRLRLDDCECEELPAPGHPLIEDAPDPDACSKPVELELRISGGNPEEGPVEIVAMVARFPYRFSRLDVEHVAAGYGANKATNGLIKANVDVVSSLRIRIHAGTFGYSSRKTVLLIVI
jgi:hypothetical protein